jgi:hypothetical protein
MAAARCISRLAAWKATLSTLTQGCSVAAWPDARKRSFDLSVVACQFGDEPRHSHPQSYAVHARHGLDQAAFVALK